MKIKCSKCGHKNSELNFSCEKCGNEFWQSKEKYDEYVEKSKDRIIEEERSTEVQEKEKKHDPRLINLLCWAPLFFFLFNLKEYTEKGGLFIVTIIKGIIMTTILLILKSILVKFAKKKEKSKAFVVSIMIALFLIVYIGISVIFALF